MVPRVETRVLTTLKEDMLAWVILYYGCYKSLFLGTKATLQISIPGVCYSLWVGSVDGFPCLYEGLLAEIEEAWDCTDIDFFIPVHMLKY